MKTIDVETLRTWLEEGVPATVLDIRPMQERAEWSIPGSIHVDAYDALKANDPKALANVELPHDRPVAQYTFFRCDAPEKDAFRTLLVPEMRLSWLMLR